MIIKYGDFNLKIFELDNKLSLQVRSGFGKVNFVKKEDFTKDFKNKIVYKVDTNIEMNKKVLKKFKFGDYSFDIEFNNITQELVLYPNSKLFISKKLINNKNALTMALTKNF